jgi:hypothetical protein
VVGAILKVLLCLCLFCLLLAACSGSPDRPDRGAQDAGSGRAEAVGGDNATARAGEGDIVIEKAFLRRGDGGDEIVVQARGGNSKRFPSCILTEGTREEAQKRAEAEVEAEEKRGEKPSGARVDSLWPKEVGGEKSVEDGAFVIVFHEDPNPPEEVADPRRMPFFAHCAGGDTFKEITGDTAHVQGTPKAP